MAQKHDQLVSQPEYEASAEDVSVSEYDRTLQGYVQLRDELQLLERTTYDDHLMYMIGDKTRVERETTARPHVEAMNANRSDPVDITGVNDKMLAHLSTPNWSEHFDRPDWDSFVGAYPLNMQINLQAMRELHRKVALLHADEALMQEVEETDAEDFEVLRNAAKWHNIDFDVQKTSEQIAAIRVGAGKARRRLTVPEKNMIERLEVHQRTLKTEQHDIELTQPVVDVLYELATIDMKKQLDSGLLMTDQMKHIIDEALPAMSRGEPVLLVGETGGAKTALAEYMSKTYFEEAELVSGYGDVNSYQLMGKQELREQHGASVSEFISGPIVRAMEDGKPLILDEINAMPPELLKRLNKIMQLRPGDSFTIQEDSGKQVIVKPGFCIIATANEKSKRYKGVEDLSVEFQNRFGANIYRVRYPDHDVPYGAEPLENVTLALATVVDKSGQMPDDIDLDDLHHFVKACHVSQQVFTGNHGEGFRDYVSTERQTDNKPGLDETVLAPRTMVDILKKVSYSYGTVTLDGALRTFVDGIKNQQDRKVLTTILKGHGFLEDKSGN